MKRNATRTMARPVQLESGLSRSEEWLLVAALYVAVVAVHLVALGECYQFPHFSTDAVQYVTTAQNIAAGHGYTVRGVFNATNPPLYPAFLAVAFAFSREPVWSAFVGQCLLSGLIVLPGYWMGRTAGLNVLVSAVLAAAVGMLPHTFFNAIFMTEALEYPLFLGLCWAAYRWLVQPSMRGSIWIGALLSLLLLNKLSSAVLIVPLLVACVAEAARRARRGELSKKTAVGAALTPFLIAGFTQGAWLWFKAGRGGSALGLYGTVLQEQGVGQASLTLTLCYGSNLLLASGLLCAYPACYFLFRRWRTQRTIAVFFGLLFLIQVVWIGVVEGGLTGALRERLMSVSFPVLAILGTRGVLDLQEDGPARWRLFLVGVPLVLLAALTVWNPGPPAALDTPWLFAFGASGWAGAATIVVTGAVVAWAKPARIAILFAASILIFNVFVFQSSAGFLSRETEHALGEAGRGIEWLKSNGAGVGKRMIVTAPPSPWELRTATWGQDPLRSCLVGTMPNLVGLWQMETYFRWDVRSVCSVSELRRIARPGDLILTEEDLGRIAGLKEYSDLENHPLRLYQFTGK